MSTDFGKRLKAARKSAGLSQVQLSKAVGISQSTIAELEKEGFGTSHVVKIAAVCGVSAAWLSTGEGEMVPSGAPAVAAPTPAPGEPTLSQALTVLAVSLNELPDERRELAAQHLQTLARAPDSKRALESLTQVFDGSNTSQGIPLESSIAGRIHEATLSVESKDIHPAKTRN